MQRILRHRIAALTLVLALTTTAAAGALVVSGHFRASTARAGGQEIDPTWANGTTVYMIGPHIIPNADPNLLAHAPELYIVSFPVDTSCAPNCGPITLPSGYQPQCNPCFHPGLPIPFVYHDHIVTGAPGFGTDGTAGSFKGPWRIVVMRYTPAYAFSPSFTPITSDEALDAAEAAGDFLPIAQGINPDNPFEIPTPNVLICPLVSSHA
jgi:hypothetical protein